MKQERILRKSLYFLMALFFVMFGAMGLVACDDDDDDDDDDIVDDDTSDDDISDDDIADDDMIDDDMIDDDTVMEESDIRALHLSPDAGIVDVYVNNALLFVEMLDFTEGTTYGTVDAGSYTINIIPTGGDPATDSVFDIPVILEGDMAYSAVVYGALGGTGLGALLIEDDTTGLAGDEIRVFVAHTADGVGEVDIWNIPDMGDPSILLENVGYGDSAFLPDLPEGAYTLGFDADNNAVPDFIFELPALTGGAQYNAFAVLDGADLFLIAQLPDGSTARINPSAR